jgi:hypothetical protein
VLYYGGWSITGWIGENKLDPNPDFIERTIENDELAKLLDKLGNYLDDCVNFGSYLVEWIGKSKKLDIHDAVLISNLRHFIEQIDACSVLIKKAISEPCLILLRASLESFIIGSYLSQSDHEQRGRAFQYFQFLEQLKFLDKIDNTTEAGKQHAAIIGKDDHLRTMSISPPTNSPTIRSDIMARINSSTYASIHAEYARLKAATPKMKIQWYMLFGGPTSIENMANVTGNSGLYEVFYRHTSGFVHGTTILSNAIDEVGLNQIRLPFNAQFVCSFSLSLCFILFKKYIEFYCKDRMPDYLRWYLSLRDGYLFVSKNDIIKFA